ncbi:MAG: transcription termination factor NusA, partial [Phenylobacterium sp.]
VEDGLLEIEGVTLPMAVALGEGDVKSVEDLAGLIPDDLRGWFENRDGERVREPGILESFNLDPAEAEALIMRARIVMGWVEAPPEPEVEEEYADDAEAEVEAEADVEAEAEAGAEETPEA